MGKKPAKPPKEKIPASVEKYLSGSDLSQSSSTDTNGRRRKWFRK
jgi:hypothetical protein